jgi:ABC-2 type transport system ATP-binding protein
MLNIEYFALPMIEKKSLIEAENVRKQYAEFVALKGVSFALKAGTATALLGPNGAGKSTTMQIILGLKQPSSGKILRRARIGYASQEIGYPLHLKVKEVLTLVAAHYDSNELIAALVERFGLTKLLSRLTGALSGGERRRLAIASAFLSRPEVLVLDEPTTGLDVESRQQLWRELAVFRDSGGSILLSTHDLNEVAQVADEALLIEKGEALFYGSLKEILAKIQARTVQYDFDGLTCTEVTMDADEYVRSLVAKKILFKNLRVREASLEEAFLELRRSRA